MRSLLVPGSIDSQAARPGQGKCRQDRDSCVTVGGRVYSIQLVRESLTMDHIAEILLSEIWTSTRMNVVLRRGFGVN